MTTLCHCDNCGRPFTPPATAPAARFCRPRCREEWHSRRKERGRRLLLACERERLGLIDTQTGHTVTLAEALEIAGAAQ